MKNLLVLLGPTGVGKTELSLLLAERLGSPIINADSRQIYKDIEIGTASPTAEELARVEHFFVHTLALDEYYSAAEYEKDVMQLLPQLFQSHDTVLLSGGSMMYIDALCNGIDDIPTVDDETRNTLKRRLAEEGLESLCEQLRVLDPEHYEIVDKKNPRRVVHALEICLMTGRTYTSFRTNEHKERPFNIIKIGLTRDREIIYERINRRVDIMMEQGFLDEARNVYPLRHLNALNTVGYKELFAYLDGTWSLDEAIERIKGNTRRYARKQLTWYKKDPLVTWFSPDDKKLILNHIIKQ